MNGSVMQGIKNDRRWWFRPGLLLTTIMPLSVPCQGQISGLTTTPESYHRQVSADPLKKIVELRSLAPGLVYDLRYATTGNFTGRRLYPARTRFTFLRDQPARALARVQDSLESLGLGLLIFDAYRPHEATRLMWELVGDERYVAHPAKGSGHNRGLAVDLTLIDRRTGQPLDMGTGFDNFTDTAHSDFTALPEKVLQNRQLLRKAMEREGFAVLPTEWWHFYWPNDRNYEVLDLKFRQLGKKRK